MSVSDTGLASYEGRVIMPTGDEVTMYRDDIVDTGSRGIVLYFYPRDNTPGCSIEAREFTELVDDFAAAGYAIYGVSSDGSDSHQQFIDSCQIGFPLISDTSLVLHHHFSTVGEKRMFGKVHTGTIRSTFVLDTDGNIISEWRSVRAKGHAQKVYQTLLSSY